MNKALKVTLIATGVIVPSIIAYQLFVTPTFYLDGINNTYRFGSITNSFRQVNNDVIGSRRFFCELFGVRWTLRVSGNDDNNRTNFDIYRNDKFKERAASVSLQNYINDYNQRNG